jgi:antitoxin PrlF
MPSPVETTSTLTDRYQTTVPQAVRDALGLSKRDKIQYTLRDDGTVILQKVESNHKDPIISAFLEFLEADMKHNPNHIRSPQTPMLERASALVADINVDLDAALNADEE